MLSRRLFCGCLTASPFVAASSSAMANTAAPVKKSAVSQACAVVTPARQSATSPTAALQALFDGNKRFVGGQTVNCDLRRQVHDTAHGQAPIATVLGCIDSRVPPELVFDQRIGDIFSCRIAGNFSTSDILGSLEFATKVAGSKAIVVLGHTQCGAIKGAIDKVKLGNLTGMLSHFDQAVEAVKDVPGERSSKNHDLVDAVCAVHAKQTAAALTRDSAVLKDLVDSKNLSIVAAIHNLETGVVKVL